jgi:hypothetical protein
MVPGRHVGAWFRFRWGAAEGLALCLCRTRRLGYLMKWLPEGTEETEEAVLTTPAFVHKHFPVDAGLRGGSLTRLGRIAGFEPDFPDQRQVALPPAPSWPTAFRVTRSGTWPCRDVEEARHLSDHAFAPAGAMELIYLHRLAPERVLDRMLAGCGP